MIIGVAASSMTVDHPRRPSPGQPTRWVVTAAALLALVFWLDAVTPGGYAIPVLYVIPTLLFVWIGRFREPLIVAAVATVLSVAGFYASPRVADVQIAVVNRILAVAVVWLTAALVVWYLRNVERWSTHVASTQRDLQESMRVLEDLRYALDQSAIVAATDHRGIITYVNDKFCEISKYSREELLGQDHRIINSAYHPKDFIRTLWRTIAQGQVWRGELRNRAKDGSIYWVDTTIVPFLNDRGKPWQYLSIRSDITQRKAAEERLRDDAALTQLGRLSAVVAHEVRNPLAGLKGSLQVLGSWLPDDRREITKTMIARIDALERTVQDILTYSRPSAPKLQRFDVHSIIVDSASSARAAVGGSEIEIDATSVVVTADPEMSRAVLLNLLLNACQAAPGGQATVEVEMNARNGHCEIAIMDRGPGIPASIREQLFQPFITTKPAGTGLGLAIARRLTHLQGGSLTLEDRSGGGTIARLTLPLGEHAPASPTTES
jgi:PAS domain S-box-containing protein